MPSKNEPLHVMSGLAPRLLGCNVKRGYRFGIVDHGPLYLTPLVIHTRRATQLQNQYKLQEGHAHTLYSAIK